MTTFVKKRPLCRRECFFLVFFVKIMAGNLRRLLGGKENLKMLMQGGRILVAAILCSFLSINVGLGVNKQSEVRNEEEITVASDAVFYDKAKPAKQKKGQGVITIRRRVGSNYYNFVK